MQAFCGTKGWPSMLMNKLFYHLYQTDIVFEDAYGVWRQDVNDRHPPMSSCGSMHACLKRTRT